MDLEFSEAVRSIAKLLLRAVSFTAVIFVKGCYTILIAPALSVVLFPLVIAWRLVTWPIEVLGPYYDDIFVLAICGLILGVISLFISAILVLAWVLMLCLSTYFFPWLSSAEEEQIEPPPPADRRSSRQGLKHRQQGRQYQHLEQPTQHRSGKSGRTSTNNIYASYPPQDEPLGSEQTKPAASNSLFNRISVSEPYSPSPAASADVESDSDSDLSPQSLRDKAAALRLRRRRQVRRAMAQPSQSAAATEGLRRRRTRTALGNRVEVDDTIHEDSLSG